MKSDSWLSSLQDIGTLVVSNLPLTPLHWREVNQSDSPSQGTNREKYFRDYNIKEKMPSLAGNEQLSIHFFPHKTRPFHISTEKLRTWPSETNIKCLIARWHNVRTYKFISLIGNVKR